MEKGGFGCRRILAGRCYVCSPAFIPSPDPRLKLPWEEWFATADKLIASTLHTSGDPKHEYLSDGITNEVITALSKSSQLFVIGRNSTFTYKGKPAKFQQVSEEMGVRYVLEGSVQFSGKRIRITAQLIDALSGYHLFSERYDQELKDIFATQDDISIEDPHATGDFAGERKPGCSPRDEKP
jgi:TolB-like protein